jgi:hypothetical protein
VSIDSHRLEPEWFSPVLLGSSGSPCLRSFAVH